MIFVMVMPLTASEIDAMVTSSQLRLLAAACWVASASVALGFSPHARELRPSRLAPLFFENTDVREWDAVDAYGFADTWHASKQA
jgi:hypothetical protein